ncbi:MAG TPA: YXWGXW repeat-containing protein [Myxococcales bacterium]|nr:YXWGXW repeat-containing protein [Myxococcales bacterium]
MNSPLKAVASALLLTLAPGCYRHGALLGTVIGTSIITAAIVSSRPPPPPRVVYMPAPRRGWVWQPGYWALQDHDWVWIEGHWIRRYPGYDWEPSQWVRDPDGEWRLIPGRWVKAPQGQPQELAPENEEEPPPPPQ